MKKVIDLIDKTNFTELLSICIGKVYSNQIELQSYLGQYQRWSVQINNGKLNIDEKEFDVDFLGTTSVSDGMWFNADLEKEIPLEYLQYINCAYDNMQKYGIQELLSKKIKLDNIYTDHSLAIIYTALAEKNTCYFKGSGDVSIFMIFKSLPENIFAPVNSNKFLNRTLDIISKFNVDAKLMIKAFAINNDNQFEETEDTIIVKFENNGSLVFKFDDKKRLINANGELQGNKLQEKNQKLKIGNSENNVKLFNAGERWILFENFDAYTDELTKHLPLEFEVIKKLDYDSNINEYLNNEEKDPNKRFNPFDCYLVKIPQIIYNNSVVDYLVIAPHFENFGENLLRIAAVTDETILNDQFIDMHKCKYFSIAHCSRVSENFDNKLAENELEEKLLKYNNNEITKNQLLEYIIQDENQYTLYFPMTKDNEVVKYNCLFSSENMLYLTNYRKIQRLPGVKSTQLQQYIEKNILSKYDIVINPRFKKVFI